MQVSHRIQNRVGFEVSFEVAGAEFPRPNENPSESGSLRAVDSLGLGSG